ncbi:MAG: tetratricopeptide repeat protein [Terricaulis sp.]
MRRPIVMALMACAAILAACCTSPARAQSANKDRDNCSEGRSPELIIAACDAVVASGTETSENLARAFNNRGLAYAELNDLPRAIAAFDDAIRVNPMYSAAYSNRGGVFAMRGDYARAIADINEALRLDPANAQGFRNRALTYQFQGDYSRAAVDFDRATALDPQNAEILNGRCWVRVLWGRQFDAALRACNEALRIAPGDANTLNSRAAVRFLLNDFANAALDYDASYRLQPSMTGSLYGRGVARLRLGQTELGHADISVAISRDADVAARYAAFGLRP